MTKYKKPRVNPG